MREKSRFGSTLLAAAGLSLLWAAELRAADLGETPSSATPSRTWVAPRDSTVRPLPWYVLPAPSNPVFRGTPRFRWGDLGVERSAPQWSSRDDYYGRWRQWSRF
ncbi:MAG: hypothetical protein Kow0040_05900 [Thermogutta sp.]